MGNCKYCGKPVGFLRFKHAECEKSHLEQEQQILVEVSKAIKGSDNFDQLEKVIVKIEQSSLVLSGDRKALLIKGWENSVEQFLQDGILDANEEKRLMEFKEWFDISSIDLNKNGALEKTAKSAVLREVLSGNIIEHAPDKGKIPINFQIGEKVVGFFVDSEYLEDKVIREFVGRSHGLSIRVMNGVYYRVNAFKGRPVEHTERLHIDTGMVVLTNKNIYFVGPKKSIRLPYQKIVSFEPFSNGIGVMQDSPTAKLQIFLTGDGWYIYNLVTNLAQLNNQYQSIPPKTKPFNPLKSF